MGETLRRIGPEMLGGLIGYMLHTFRHAVYHALLDGLARLVHRR
jgi:hypothetical protein